MRSSTPGNNPHSQKGGKVLGICNGFQILCECGLLPGVLLRNSHQQFVCKNVFIKEAASDGDAVHPSAPLMIPVAHGEGRYFADDKTLEELEMHRQIIYRYCDEKSVVNSDSNPNGAIHNIAGICNKERNVYGMMPHPERACSSALGNEDGKKIFAHLFGIN